MLVGAASDHKTVMAKDRPSRTGQGAGKWRQRVSSMRLSGRPRMRTGMGKGPVGPGAGDMRRRRLGGIP